MTKIYLGGNLYEIHIGHQKITLSGDKSDELSSEFVEELAEVNHELELSIELIDKLEEENDDLQDAVSTLELQIWKYEDQKSTEK